MALLRKLEIVSLLTTLIGLYLISEKIAIGFLVFDISLICQAIIFYSQKNRFLIFQMFVLIVYNTYIYFKWTGGI